MTEQMTRRDIEIAVLQVGEALKAIVEAYNDKANHITLSVVNGQISVSACEYDDAKMDIKESILYGVQFPDGTVYADGQYTRPTEVA